jgi:hypothetical protein
MCRLGLSSSEDEQIFFILKNYVSIWANAYGNEYFHIGMSIIDSQTFTVRYCHIHISLSTIQSCYSTPFYIAMQRYQLSQPRETKQVSYMDWIIRETRSFGMSINRSPPVSLDAENIHLISCFER